MALNSTKRSRSIALATFVLAGLIAARPEPAEAGVKRVQSGIQNMAVTPVTVTIDAVDTTRSFVICYNRVPGDAPATYSYCDLSGPTSLDIRNFEANASTFVHWQVVEFNSGARVQRGLTSLGVSETALNVPLQTVDTGKSFALVTSAVALTMVNDPDERRTIRARLTSGSNLELSRNESGSTVNVAWQVVELEDATVQSGLTTISGVLNNTANISSVDLNRTFLTFSTRGGAGVAGDEGRYMVRGYFSDPTTITFNRLATADSVDISWFAVTMSDGTTVEANNYAAGAESTVDLGVGPLPVATSAAFLSSNVLASAFNLDNGTWAPSFTSPTNLRLERGSITAASNIGWFAVRFASDFTCRKSIIIDRSKVGKPATVTVNDQPFLFSVTDPDLRTRLNGGMVESTSGFDLMFRALEAATCGGVKANCLLDHEIEKYDPVTGELVAWVRIPVLNGQAAASDTEIFLYFGNNGITSSFENPNGVWDPSYEGVWHLHGDALDSTSNGNNGTEFSTANSIGFIGDGESFNGSTSRIETLNLANSLNVGQDFTVSAWVKRNSTAATHAFLSKFTSTHYSFKVSYDIPNGNATRIDVLDSSQVADFFNGDVVADTGWHHIVARSDGALLTTFLDGNKNPGSAPVTRTIFYDASPFVMGVGQWASGLLDHFDGVLDEVRVSDAAISDAAIETLFRNESSPSTFYTVGPKEALSSYSCRKAITVDRTKVGLGGTMSVSDYPMLFSVTDGDLAHTGSGGKVTSASGDDIIFQAYGTATCGGPPSCTLSHEIELYNSATGELRAWVRLPSVNGQAAASNTVIYVLYGNGSITSPTERPSDVWDSGFQSVWHLEEIATSGPDDFRDSTVNGYHADSDPAATLIQKKTAILDATGTVITATFDATPTEGNLLVGLLGLVGNRVITLPGGWSTAVLQQNPSDPGVAIFYKIAGPNEASAVTVTIDAAANRALHIYEYAGVDETNPFDAVSIAPAGVTTVPTGSTAVTVQPNELLIASATTRAPVNFLSWSNSFNSLDSSANANFNFETADRVVSATAAYDTTATFDAVVNGGAGAVATFRLRGTPDQTPGKIGNGQDFEFDDAADVITVTSNPAALKFGSGSFSLETWYRPESIADTSTSSGLYETFNHTVAGCGAPGNTGIRLAHTTTGQVFLEIANPAPGGGVTSTTNISPGTWYHIATVYNGANASIYINGNLEATAPGPNPGVHPLARPAMGAADCVAASGGEGKFADGILDEMRTSDVTRSAAYIKTSYNNQDSPATFYSVGSEECQTTAVELVDFRATAGDGEVLLEWETGSELDNLGFHLYRARAVDGPFAPVTVSPIPGLGTTPAGARYQFRDVGLVNGVTYYYQLEDIETHGETMRHRTISATPREGSSMADDREGEAEGDGSGEARITYGDPTSNRLTVRRSRSGVTLELETNGFYAVPLEDGGVRLSIPDFLELEQEGAPSIPVRRTRVDALAGRGLRLVSARVMEVESFQGLVPSSSRTELVASRDTIRARRRRQRFAGPSSVYPAVSARVVSLDFQGERKTGLIELAPLRWDGASRQWSLARRLIVRLAFDGRESGEGEGRRYRRRRSHAAPRLLARLRSDERGIHALSFEDIFGARGSTGRLPASELRLSRQGDAVAYHLEPQGDWFGPGSRLYFFSEGPSANPYGNDLVFELETGREGLRMPVRSTGAEAASDPVYIERVVREENRYYQAGLTGEKDLWLWDVLLAPVTKTYRFEVSGLVTDVHPAEVSVEVQGTSDLPASPDHHLRLHLNGAFLAEHRWDGKRSAKLETSFPASLLLEGANELTIESTGETEAAYSLVMLNRFSVAYPRRATAEGGALEGEWLSSGTISVKGLGAGSAALELLSEAPTWVETRAGSGGLLVSAERGRSFAITARSAVKRPEVFGVAPLALKRKRSGADYLVIAPAVFRAALLPLLEERSRQGLSTLLVPVEQVFEEFGFGEHSPEAIRDFVSFAYHRWDGPRPRYLLLVGDGHYDFKDYLGLGKENHLPPLMIETSTLWTASDPTLAAVNGEDALPDLSVGRLPAASFEEAETMVEKLLAFERGTSTQPPIALVADDPDDAGHFERDAEDLAREVESLTTRELQRIYLSEGGAGLTGERILESFDGGLSLMSYLGHGGIQLWANEKIFDTEAVSLLSPQTEQPLVLTMNCLNGYFHFPYFDSLAEALVKAEGKGAIAAFSPSGLSYSEPAQRYHRLLLREVLGGGHRRLGDAILAAQSDYAAFGGQPELLSVYHLFGDPAMLLPR